MIFMFILVGKGVIGIFGQHRKICEVCGYPFLIFEKYISEKFEFI